MKNKEFDLIVYGATSFVGQILCRYLSSEHKEPNFTWVMAARSESKLKTLKDSLGPEAAQIPTLVADSMDEEALLDLCQRTEVIVSTVGPYALYGELLIKACAQSGTDYCDITGETHWVRQMIEKYQDDAAASGARIVNCCGFDSIPSDLGVKFLQDQASRKFGSPCNRVKMRVQASKGSMSGGTIASGINVYKQAARDPALREELKNLYSLCGEGHGNEAKQHTVNGVEFDEDFQAWIGPFFMAAVNTRVVLRSNALTNNAYGVPFYYDEATIGGVGEAGKKKARKLVSGSKVAMTMMTLPPLRWLATRFFLPKPGEGPSPREQQEGFFDLRFHGSTERGDWIKAKVSGDRDPGYGSTAKMLAQAAISLHRAVDKVEKPGGFWTPAAIFGDDLIRRLQDHAGFTFEVLELTEAPGTETGSETRPQ